MRFASAEEQRRLLVRGKVRCNGLEAVVHLVERGVQTGNRKIAAEHGPLRAEAVDAMQDDRPQAVERPVMIIGDEIGDLDRDIVVLAPARAEPVAPAPHALGVAVDRAAAMVEDELLVGKAAASRAASASWRGNTIRSKTRPWRASSARPARQAGSSMMPSRAAKRRADPGPSSVCRAPRRRARTPPAPRAEPALSAGERDMRRHSGRRRRATCRASPASASRRRSRRSPSPPRHGRWRRHRARRRRADNPQADSCGASGPRSPSPPRSPAAAASQGCRPRPRSQR